MAGDLLRGVRLAQPDLRLAKRNFRNLGRQPGPQTPRGPGLVADYEDRLFLHEILPQVTYADYEAPKGHARQSDCIDGSGRLAAATLIG